MDKVILVVCTRDLRNELVEVECETLTGKKPMNGIAEGGSVEFLPHSAYLRLAMRVIARDVTVEQLARTIERLKLDVDGFRIEVLGLSERVKLPRRETIIALADAITCYRPDLDHPCHRLVLVVSESELIFGEILAEPDHSYRQHDRKPFRTSCSLPARLARGMVNLVLPYARTISRSLLRNGLNAS